MATLIRAAFGSLSSLRSVRIPNAFICNPKCVYHVLTQIVYNVTLDSGSHPTVTDVATVKLKPSPVGEGGSRRLTDEVSLTQSNSSSPAIAVPLLPQEKAT